MSMACLVDTTKCIGCRACQVACKEWNDLPPETPPGEGRTRSIENSSTFSSKTYTRVTFHEVLGTGGWLDRAVSVKRQCMHCLEPSCASACPVAALKKTPDGAVVYDGQRCMGCRYCMVACPFGVPTLEWDKPVPYIRKCTFCMDRRQDAPARWEVNGKPLEGETLERFRRAGQMPACAKVCPAGAITYGPRDQLLAEASQRIARQNVRGASWRYVEHIYGEKEVGGTSWLYISNVPFESLGFRTDLGDRPYPEYTKLALDAVPVAVIGVGLALGGVYWISQRRQALAQAAADDNEE